ncbi:MAG: hypothetical protein ACRD5L_18310 [Bryobacteraceae bacterium]
MARASSQTAQYTDQERAAINATNQQLLAQQAGLGNTATAGYQNMLANPGYTQAQQAAITGATQGSLASAFDALSQRAANRVARTNNSAGFSDSLDQLARSQGQQQASAAQQNQIAFANNAQDQQSRALAGLSGLYGVDANMLSRTLGIPAQLLDARARVTPGSPSSFHLGFGPVGLNIGL